MRYEIYDWYDKETDTYHYCVVELNTGRRLAYYPMNEIGFAKAKNLIRRLQNETK